MLLNYSGSSSESSGSLARRRTEAQRESAYSSCDADLLSQSDGSDEEIYVFEDASSVEGHCSSVEDPVFQPYKSARPSLLSTHSQSSLDDDPVFQPYESASAWPSSPRVVQKSSHASLYDDADEGKPSTRSQRQSFTEEEEERKSLQELQEKLAKHKRRRSRRRKPSTSSHQNCDYDQDRSNERFRLDNSVQEDFSDDAEERITSTRSQAQDVMEEESKFPQEGQEKQAKHSQPDWNATPSIRVHKSSHARLSHHSKRAKSSTRRHRRVVTEEETSKSSQQGQEKQATHSQPDWSATPSIRRHKSLHARSSYHAKKGKPSTRSQRRDVMDEERKFLQEAQENDTKHWHLDWSASPSIRVAIEEERSKLLQEKQEKQAKQLSPDVSASPSIRLHKSSHARSSHHAKEGKPSTRSQRREVTEEESTLCQEGHENFKKDTRDTSSDSWGVFNSHQNHDRDRYRSNGSIRRRNSASADLCHYAEEMTTSTRDADERRTSLPSQRQTVMEKETPSDRRPSCSSHRSHDRDSYRSNGSVRRRNSASADLYHDAEEMKTSTRSQRRDGEK